MDDDSLSGLQGLVLRSSIRHRIGFRLAVGFGVLLLIAALIGAISARTLQANYRSAQVIVEENNAKIAILQRERSALLQIWTSARDMILTTDPALRKRLQDGIAASRAEYGAANKKLAEIMQESDEKAGLAKLEESIVPARAAFNKLFEAANANDVARASDVLFAQARPAQEVVFGAVQSLIELEEKKTATAIASMAESYRQSLWLLAAAFVAATLLGVAIAWRITRSVVRPLGVAVDVAEAVAGGDLTRQVDTSGRDETGRLLRAMAAMTQRLHEVIGTIEATTGAVGVASRQIAAGNSDLSKRTEAQAASLEETAASMEELTSTVKQNADNARQANQLAASASEVAVRGGGVVREVVTTMSSISASSKKIADIIGVIDGIAFQTNILALNAAVEAARAGEQGRGFAVVASEVRSLAQRSAAAAKEIKDLITDSVGQVESGAQLVDDAGRTIDEVVAAVKRVTDIMAEITAASLEQSAGIEQVNEAVTQMDQGTQQNASLVEQSAASARSLEEQAVQLAQQVAVFRLARAAAAKPAASKAQPPLVAEATPAARPGARARPVAAAARPKPAPSLATVAGRSGTATDDWQEF